MNARWRVLGSRLNPSCRDMMVLFSRSLDRTPSRAERLVLGVHLLHCPACRRSRRQISLLVGMLRLCSGKQAGGAAEALPRLPAAVRERILAALRRE